MKPHLTIRIALTGAHSTGKSTLARALGAELESSGKNVAIIGGLGRRLIAEGIPVNRQSTLQTYVAIMALHMEEQRRARGDYIILDRFMPDHAAYAIVHGSCPDYVLRLMREIHAISANRYPCKRVFLLEPEFPVEPDGARDPDPAYQREVSTALVDVLRKWRIKYSVVEGPVKSRVRQIIRSVGERNG